MNQQDVVRMIGYMTEGAETAEDIKFVDEHLEGFQTWLLNVATHDLVKKGFDEDEAMSMLGSIAQVSRMVGAKNFDEFVRFHNIVQDF